jgi:AraC-like DNA-binding protein/mannose-6-phosphate isomerase-like protein (cupin superfamily)
MPGNVENLPTSGGVPMTDVAILASELPAGHRIAPHAHRRNQLIYARHGVMRVTTAEGSWIVPPERALWMPARLRHEIHCTGAVSMRTIYVSAAAAPRLPRRCVMLAVSPFMRELLLRLVEARPAAQARRHLVPLILAELSALPVSPLHLPEPRDRRLRRLTEALKRRPDDPQRLTDWQLVAGASARTLSRLFVAETGMTFRQWQRQLRLLIALERLAQGRNVTDVALDVGYGSPSAFISVFRQSLGTTPRRYFAPTRDPVPAARALK